MAFKHQGVSEQTKAAFQRRRDAHALLDDGKHHTRGAMYLGGYAIECKIKAKAMEAHGCRTLDELRDKLEVSEDVVYSHGLEALVAELLPEGTKRRLLSGEARPAFVSQVNHWKPHWRYSPANPPASTAKEFLDAVSVVWNWLEKNV